MIGLKLTAIVGAAGLALSGATYLMGKQAGAEAQIQKIQASITEQYRVALDETYKARAAEQQLQDFVDDQSAELTETYERLAEAEADATIELDSAHATANRLRSLLASARSSDATSQDTATRLSGDVADWQRAFTECQSEGDSMAAEIVRMAGIADDRKLRLDAAQDYIRVTLATVNQRDES